MRPHLPSPLRAALLAAALCAGLPATPAGADAFHGTWHKDSARGDIASGPFNCDTGAMDGHSYWTVIPAIQTAAALFDEAAPPPIGDVEYVSVAWSAGLGDGCEQTGGRTGVTIEVIPPEGTHFAADAPAYCSIGFGNGSFVCPVGVAPGDYGGTKLLDGRGGDPITWSLPDGHNMLGLAIPLRVDRQISAFGSTAEKDCGGPCAPSAMPGRAQIAARFDAGGHGNWSPPVVTSVGLLTGGAAPGPVQPVGPVGPTKLDQPVKPDGPPPPASSSLFAGRVPARLTRSALRRGVPVGVAVDTARTRVTVRLTSGGRTLARATSVASRAGRLSLRLHASRRALRRLGAGRRSARIVITERAPGAKA
ncbi:MAG TPA: hypothetical protein VF533_11510, partial [Solirubrobacteraceae bacterium]